MPSGLTTKPPALPVDPLLVFASDNRGASFVIALDAATGDTRWRIERKAGKAAYATPCVWQAPDGSRQLILCSMAEGMVGVAPDDGRLFVATARRIHEPVHKLTYRG